MEENIICIVLIRTDVGKEHEIASVLRRMLEKRRIGEVYVTYGLYDVVVKFSASTLRDVDTVVTSIRGIPGIRETVTLISS